MPGALTKPLWSAFTLWHAARARSLPTWPGERVQAVQNRRVRAIVAHAWKTVPFYRRAMEERALRPADLATGEDLAKLPLISGAQLAADPWAFFSSRYKTSATLELPTSGSTGHFKRIFHSPAAMFITRAHWQRFGTVLRTILGTTRGYRELSVSRPGGSGPAMAEFFHSRALMPRRLSHQRRDLSITATFEEALAAMQEWQPDVLQAYGSYAAALFRHAHDRAIKVPLPRVVVFGGDGMAPSERAQIEDDLGIMVLSTYQACECLFIGFECEHRRGFHINVDGVAVRIVDPSGKTLAPGERGAVVISNLLNRATVLLNYQLGDVGSLEVSPCPCGRALPRLLSLDGRADDLVELPDGRHVHESVILSSLYAVPGVARVQVIQEGPASFVLRVVDDVAGSHDSIHRDAELALRRALALDGDVTVRTECVRTLPAEPSGKIKSIVSLLRRPAASPAGLRYTSLGRAGGLSAATAQGIDRESDHG